jgi:hypothetical protein
LEIQFLKPLFGRGSSTTVSQNFLSRREIFALIVASVSVAILIALGYLLTGWNPANFKDDVLSIMLTLIVIIVGIASPTLVFGFRPRVLKYLEKPENLPRPENQKSEKINSEQQIRPTRKHTENLRTEVYENLLQMTRTFGVSEPYTLDYVIRQGREGPILVENLRYLERGIEHLRTGAYYQVVHALWEELKTQKRTYNERLHGIREEIKAMIITRTRQYLGSFHERENAKSPMIQKYFSSIALVDFIVDVINSGLNRGVVPDLRIQRTRHHSYDGNWYQLEGVSERTDYVLLQSLSPITNEDEQNLRQLLSEIRDNPPLVRAVAEMVRLYSQNFDKLLEFKKELRKLVEQIKDIEDNYIIEGSCTACRSAVTQSPIEPSND